VFEEMPEQLLRLASDRMPPSSEYIVEAFVLAYEREPHFQISSVATANPMQKQLELTRGGEV
jgi:hypothetical protein